MMKLPLAIVPKREIREKNDTIAPFSLFLRHEKAVVANRLLFDGPCSAVRLGRMGREVPLLH